jgi:2-polyprenyl-3-methyl-5-hydroxy-6-metoxy-1,4-benzoquinol methylase
MVVALEPDVAEERVPVYRSRTVLEVARNLRAFLDLNAGLIRGEVPQDLEQVSRRLRQAHGHVEQLKEQLADKDRQLEQARERPPGKDRPTPEDQAGARNAVGREKQAGEAIVGDPRDHFIGRVARGRSFADVGGLYGTVSEKVSVARSHGATELAMIDIVPEGNELWRAFSDRMQQLGISGYETISDSILDLAESPDHPRYDVVHCTGVLYHMPDPMRLLTALRSITREYLVLGSAVTATSISGNGETLKIPSAAALFIPALKEGERAILEGYWRPFVGHDALGLTREQKPWDVEDFAPWWWLPTVDCMRAMCESAGFAYEGGAHYWNDNAYVMLLSRRQP